MPRSCGGNEIGRARRACSHASSRPRSTRSVSFLGPGRRVRLRGHATARRLLLRRSEYHVYYVVHEQNREVRIVYFRHSRRRPFRSP